MLSEEFPVAHAEDGQRQAGDILVGPEGDGEEGIEEAPQGGGQKGRDKGQDHRHHGDGVPSGNALIEKRGDEAGGAAHIEKPLHAQVQVAGFLGQDLPQGAVHQGGAHEDGGHKKVHKECHAAASFCFFRKIIR